MKRAYRLLVLDLDGTLVGKGGMVTENDSKALGRVKKAGIKVSLSTGRMPQACRSFFSQLHLKGLHIFYDGAIVADAAGKGSILRQGLDKALARDMALQARQIGLYLELYTSKGYFAEKNTEATSIHVRLLGVEPEIKEFLEFLKGREEIIKAGSTIISERDRQGLENFERHFEGKLRFTHALASDFPGVVFVNMVHPLVSKGKALEALALHLGIPLSEVVAIGDGENDIPLLTTAGLGIAMGNAPEKVKGSASAVTLSQEEGGVAHALEKYIGL